MSSLCCWQAAVLTGKSLSSKRIHHVPGIPGKAHARSLLQATRVSATSRLDCDHREGITTPPVDAQTRGQARRDRPAAHRRRDRPHVAYWQYRPTDWNCDGDPWLADHPGVDMTVDDRNCRRRKLHRPRRNRTFRRSGGHFSRLVRRRPAMAKGVLCVLGPSGNQGPDVGRRSPSPHLRGSAARVHRCFERVPCRGGEPRA